MPTPPLPAPFWNAPRYPDGGIDTEDPFNQYINMVMENHPEDPVTFREIFGDCHANRVYPPPEIMDWLARAILQEEPKEIQALLGLKAPSRGREDPIRERRRVNRDYDHAVWVFWLSHFAGVSVQNAAEGVYERCLQEKRDVADPSWIEDQYRRKWKKKFIEDPPLIPFDTRPDLLPRFLAMFPKDWLKRVGLK
jgi:hypothetical protein